MRISRLFKVFPAFGIAILCIGGCATLPKGHFGVADLPPKPDYRDTSAWAALPGMPDSADIVPGAQFRNRQDSARVDVFFLHPTTYIGKRGQDQWNAPVDDPKVNLRTDKGSIRYQATVFNGSARVYAPRYRQAHLEAFYTKKRQRDAEKALDLAYEDVRAAFLYYLENYRQNRPFIIASHSQGSIHAVRLIREEIDGKRLADKLVAAYIVGWPVKRNAFEHIPVCTTPEQVGCFCSWRTFKTGHYPRKWYTPGQDIAVTNPIAWMTTEEYIGKDQHQGAILKNFRKGPYIARFDAQVRDGLLWTSGIGNPLWALYLGKNYHILDYNLFYVDIRKNVAERIHTFMHNTR